MSKVKEFPLAPDIWGVVKWQTSKNSQYNRTFESNSCFSLFQRLLIQFELFEDWNCEKLILFINSFYHFLHNYHTVFNKTWHDCNACGSGAISEVGRLKNATCKSCIYYIRSVTVVPVLHCHVWNIARQLTRAGIWVDYKFGGPVAKWAEEPAKNWYISPLMPRTKKPIIPFLPVNRQDIFLPNVILSLDTHQDKGKSCSKLCKDFYGNCYKRVTG